MVAKGGIVGIKGEIYEHDPDQSQSSNGEDGVNGMRGYNGKTRTAPKVHVYERLK
jgi:hypothetical protein